MSENPKGKERNPKKREKNPKDNILNIKTKVSACNFLIIVDQNFNNQGILTSF
jgi:hypothetical protein